MKRTLQILGGTSFMAAGSFVYAQTPANVVIDGTSGSNSIANSYSTTGGLSLSLGFFADYLVVGGGGSGGTAGDTSGTGGGGAGGLLQGNVRLSATNYSVAVGAGGVAPATAGSTSVQGVNGGNSVFGNLTAVGGGGGGRFNQAGNTGGSGGGGGGRNTTAGGAGTTSNSMVQGHAGGSARGGTPDGRSAGGGGGGAGGPGGNARETISWSGFGGPGLASSITGTEVFYAGGGSGGAKDNFANSTIDLPGVGGGGQGSGIGDAISGTNGLGGGGGGAGSFGRGGNGGSGVVIVRYSGESLGNIGGTVSAGTGSAAGYTLHTFTNTGSANFNLSGLDLSSRLGATVSGNISGDGDLSFAGPGRLTLNAANTYSGLTRVNAGTLALGSGGSIGASSGISIANGANFNVSTVSGGFTLGANQTLSGGGIITGDVVISGTHSPGFSPGIQTFEDGLSYTTGSTIEWELLDARVDDRGIIYDGIDVDGNLSFEPGVTLSLDFATLGSYVDWRDAFWAGSITGTAGWKVFDVQGTISGFENLQIAGDDWVDSLSNNLSSLRPDASFSLFQGTDGIYLNYSAVPEPAAALLGGLGMLVLLRRRRF